MNTLISMLKTADLIIGSEKYMHDDFIELSNQSLLKNLAQIADELDLNDVTGKDFKYYQSLTSLINEAIKKITYINSKYERLLESVLDRLHQYSDTVSTELKNFVISNNNDFVEFKIEGQKTQNHTIQLGLLASLLQPFQDTVTALGNLGNTTKTKINGNIFTNLELMGIGAGSVKLYMKTSARNTVLDTQVNVAIDSLGELFSSEINAEFKARIMNTFKDSLKHVDHFANEIIKNDIDVTIQVYNNLNTDSKPVILKKEDIMPYKDYFTTLLSEIDDYETKEILIEGYIDGIRLPAKKVWICQGKQTREVVYQEDMEQSLLDLIQSHNPALFKIHEVSSKKLTKTSVTYTLVEIGSLLVE